MLSDFMDLPIDLPSQTNPQQPKQEIKEPQPTQPQKPVGKRFINPDELDNIELQ